MSASISAFKFVLPRKSAVLLLACWLLLAPAGPVFADAIGAGLAGPALVEALRKGGYSIYFRHEATDWSQFDHAMQTDRRFSCEPSEMRQLSKLGRDRATRTGNAMRQLQIPVSRVVASPYCRTVETARLFGLGEVATSNDVMNLRVAQFYGGRSQIIQRARALLAQPPEAGANQVIVAHGNVAQAATPVYPDEGEGVVFQADGQGGFYVIGRISPSAWVGLAEALR